MNCKTVCILLSTFNGEQYLQKQLDSLYSQTYENFIVIARDDMSSDKTLEILSRNNIELLHSTKNIGAKQSFSVLLEFALKETNVDYFMFCDQDDIWNKDKIEKTISKMTRIEKEVSNKLLLVHSDLEVVDENLISIHRSFWEHEFIVPKYNSFNRLLMQNTVTGCTVMINRQLAELALPIANKSIMHDWWLGLVASKFGTIVHINESLIKYRQHDKNTIGANGFSYMGVFKKFYKIFYKNDLYIDHLSVNIKQAKAFLDKYCDDLDDKTIKMLEDFIAIESKSFWQKRKVLLQYKLLKHGFIRNLGLLLKI